MKSTVHLGTVLASVLLAFVLVVAFNSFPAFSFEQGPNNRNVSVDTTVNITNSPPIVYNVIIENNATNITLVAGSWKNITCNATILDYNGAETITNVSATFFHASVNTSAPDDNNTHYFTNCTPWAAYGTYERNVSCSFLVQYYANVGIWYCNVTATDPYNFTNSSMRTRWNHTTTHIDTLLALNVTPLIDYGELATGDYSTPQNANVTNLGNTNINVSVRGYGNVSGDGLAMYCQIGNIPIVNEMYNLVGGSNPALYTPLTGSATQIGGLTIVQQTNDSQQVINSTNWLLYVPPGPFGRCNGTVVFQAERS
jgi:hypothetical protein